MSGHSASTATAFVFSSEPRAIAPRKKYREPLYLRNADSVDKSKGNCIQYDKRVARGITAMGADQPRENLPMMGQETVESPEAQLDQTKADSAQRWLDEARTAAKEQMKVSFAPKTMDVTRKHIEVDLSAFLIEEVIPVDVKIMQTQTDVFQPRPPSPDYVPKRTGLDVATQIYSGDLFDFDREVDLILDVITGKTLEQSMMEVMEEEELANMRAHQEHFEQIRNAELAETQRLEEAEKRRFEEKERRVEQERERVEREQQVTEKVAARTFTKGFLSDLQSSVVENLKESGFFFDPLEAEVKDTFVPWLLDSMEASVEQLRVARELTDDLIETAGMRQRLMQLEANKLREQVEEAKLAAVAEASAAAAAAEAAAAAAAEAAAAPAEEAPAEAAEEAA